MNAFQVVEATVLMMICVISVVGNVSLFVVVLTGGRDFRTVSNSPHAQPRLC